MSRETSGTPHPELYRQIIDWAGRLRREGPMLEESLRLDRGARVLDLGCGAGDHARWLAARVGSVVAVDREPAMLAEAREANASDPIAGQSIELVEAGIETLPETLAGPFDAAICLGNTLVHLLELDEVRAFARGVGSRLRPGGRLLVQILNYEAIVAERRRAMKPVLRPGGDGTELVFLRFMDHLPAPDDGPDLVDFHSVVLARGAAEVETTVVSDRRARMRAWTRAELVPVLESEVGPVEAFGSMTGDGFDPVRSSDLVLLVERPSSPLTKSERPFSTGA